jgi:hypothetical protein
MSTHVADEAIFKRTVNTGHTYPRLSLIHLPDDILLEILSLLDAEAVAALSQVTLPFCFMVSHRCNNQLFL